MIETIEKPATRETPTERGHWRCVFFPLERAPLEHEQAARKRGWRELDGEWVAPMKYSSERDANEDGPARAAHANELTRRKLWIYVRAEFFPEL